MEAAPICSVDFAMNGRPHTLSVRPSETAELWMASSTEDTLSHRIRLGVNLIRGELRRAIVRQREQMREQLDALIRSAEPVLSVERQIRRYPYGPGVPVVPPAGGMIYPIQQQLGAMTATLQTIATDSE